MEPAIQIEGVALEISQEGLEAMLAQRGVQVKLSAINLQVSAGALVTLLARLMPDVEVGARVSPAGVVLERQGEGGPVRVELAVTELRIRPAEDRLELRSE
jgi:hypothetical protein